LLLEGRDDFLFVKTKCVRVLPEKTAGEDAARKTIELVRLHGFEQVQADLGLCGYLFQLQATADSFAAERIADRGHRGLLNAPFDP
jgi:hypothetical protein